MPLGKAHSEIHLHHASKPPLVVYSEAEKHAAMFDAQGEPTGYGTEYVQQDYPKMVHVGEDKDGNAIQTPVANAAEEKALLAGMEKTTKKSRKTAAEVKA